jgi:hypothetical protein
MGLSGTGMAVLVRFTLRLCALSSLLLALVMLLPSDDHVMAFFGANADCPMPCWQGIHPGSTRYEDAREIITHHTWLRDVQLGSFDAEGSTTPQFAYWSWASAHHTPRVISSPLGIDGLFSVTHGRVTTLVVRSEITLGEMWLGLGAPQRFTFQRLGYRDGLVHELLFNNFGGSGVSAVAYHACPMTVATLWNSPVEISMTAYALQPSHLRANFLGEIVRLMQRDRHYC